MTAPIYTEPLSGNCPVQAGGITDCGLPWYFRARDCFQIWIGTEPDKHALDSVLAYLDEASLPQFDCNEYPGWASHETCERFIVAALAEFERSRK